MKYLQNDINFDLLISFLMYKITKDYIVSNIFILQYRMSLSLGLTHSNFFYSITSETFKNIVYDYNENIFGNEHRSRKTLQINTGIYFDIEVKGNNK